MAARILGGTSGKTLQIRLVEDAVAEGQAAPSLVTDGFSLVDITHEFKFEDRGLVMIHHAGDGAEVSIVSAKIHAFYAEREEGAGPDDWGPLGAGGADIASGALNEGAQIDQDGTRKILLLESVGGMRSIERVAVSLGAISTSSGDPLVHVDLILTRASR